MRHGSAPGLVRGEDAQGRTTAVSLPDGATHALPEGFSQVLSSYFYADTVAKDEEGHSRRILATGTGVVIDLPDLSSCQGLVPGPCAGPRPAWCRR